MCTVLGARTQHTRLLDRVQSQIDGISAAGKKAWAHKDARIGPILGIPASTVHRVLTRQGLNRLRWMDRPTGQVIRRYERSRPGELNHVDIKKLGNNPRQRRPPHHAPPASHRQPAGHNRRS